MLLLLLSYLKTVCQVPAVFFYSSTRMILAALTALGVTLFLGPMCIRRLYVLKTGQSIRVEDCPMLAQLHAKKKDTPTMGGVLILFAMIVALLLWMDLHSVFTLLLFVTTLFVGAIGVRDDYLKLKFKNSRGLRSGRKFLLQGVLAAGIAFYLFYPPCAAWLTSGEWFISPVAREMTQSKESVLSLATYSAMYYMPFWKEVLVSVQDISLVFAFLFTMFVIVGSSNAVNLTDGLDGLAAGCLLMVAMVLALFGFLSNNQELARYLHILYIEGSAEVAIYLFAMAGACLGFLWFNGSPAQVFMGDTGSLALGAVLGVSAVLLRRELLLGLIGGVFVAETLSVMLQVISYRLRQKKRIFLCAPLHHHFEYKGWPETKVVLRFWIVNFLLCLLGIMSLKLQ